MGQHEAANACKNCGRELSGAHCSGCGQSAATRRLDGRALLRQFFDNFTALDHPLPATLRGLSSEPGTMIARYVAGERVKFIAPLRYALWFIGLYVLVLQFADVVPLSISVSSSAGAEEAARVLERMSQAVRGTWQLATLTALPLLAWLQRGLFRRSGRNYAEGVAFQLYVTGHLHLLSIVLTPLNVVAQKPFVVVRWVLALAFMTWAAKPFFRESGLRTAAKVLLILLAQLLLVLAIMLFAVFPALEALSAN